VNHIWTNPFHQQSGFPEAGSLSRAAEHCGAVLPGSGAQRRTLDRVAGGNILRSVGRGSSLVSGTLSSGRFQVGTLWDEIGFEKLPESHQQSASQGDDANPSHPAVAPGKAFLVPTAELALGLET
jgi:hypothetical protein